MVKIIETLIPENTPARPGTNLRKFTGVTIHETDNYSEGAGAYNHSQYKTVNGGWNVEESYHYVVDDKEAYRLVPEKEVTWQAGDGFSGVGNNETVSIEICVNSDSDFEKSVNNAAELTADILNRKGIRKASGYVYQHNNWSGKNCPNKIRASGRWEEFIEKVQKYLDGKVDKNMINKYNGKYINMHSWVPRWRIFDIFSDELLGEIIPKAHNGLSYEILGCTKDTDKEKMFIIKTGFAGLVSVLHWEDGNSSITDVPKYGAKKADIEEGKKIEELEKENKELKEKVENAKKVLE